MRKENYQCEHYLFIKPCSWRTIIWKKIAHNSHALWSQVMDERQLTYSNELHLGKEKKIPSSFVLQNPQTVCFITEPYRQERTQGRARAGVTLCNLSSFRETKKIICLLFFECALENALKATRASKIPLALGTQWYFWMKRIEFDAVWGLCELSDRPESSPSSCKPHREPQGNKHTSWGWEAYSLKSHVPPPGTTGAFTRFTSTTPDSDRLSAPGSSCLSRACQGT